MICLEKVRGIWYVKGLQQKPSCDQRSPPDMPHRAAPGAAKNMTTELMARRATGRSGNSTRETMEPHIENYFFFYSSL